MRTARASDKQQDHHQGDGGKTFHQLATRITPTLWPCNNDDAGTACLQLARGEAQKRARKGFRRTIGLQSRHLQRHSVRLAVKGMLQLWL
jgi:hypothetical protein